MTTTTTRRTTTALQPVLGPLAEGDLCDIRTGRRYCQADAVHEAIDADGRTRLLCAEHVELYFPAAFAAA